MVRGIVTAALATASLLAGCQQIMDRPSGESERAVACTGTECRFQCEGTDCTCELSDAARNDAHEKLQACLNNMPAGGRLALAPGVYRIAKTLTIKKAMTLTSRTNADNCSNDANCAVIKALPSFVPRTDPESTDPVHFDGGLLWALGGDADNRNLSHVVVEKLVLDGNKEARIAAGNLAGCDQRGDGRLRFGGRMMRLGSHLRSNCDDCVVRRVVLRNGLCTSAIAARGDRIQILDNAIVEHGFGEYNGSQAFRGDGIAFVAGSDLRIRGNLIRSASDVGIMLQTGPRARIENNTIQQDQNQLAHAIHMHHGGPAQLGDYTDAVIANNTIRCTDLTGKSACDVGIMMGPLSYRATAPFRVRGGTVVNNVVTGARIGILVDGLMDTAGSSASLSTDGTVGTFANSPVIANNTVSGTPAKGATGFYCNPRNADDIQPRPYGYVDYQGSAPLPSAFVHDMEYRGICNDHKGEGVIGESQPPPPTFTPRPTATFTPRPTPTFTPVPPAPPTPTNTPRPSSGDVPIQPGNPAGGTAHVEVKGWMFWTDDQNGTHYINTQYPFSTVNFPIARSRTIYICGRCERFQDGVKQGTVSVHARTEFTSGVVVDHGSSSDNDGEIQACHYIGPSDHTSVRVLTCDAGANLTTTGRVVNPRN